MSTRAYPERSGAVEIATRRCPRLRVVRDLRKLTHLQNPRLWRLPAGHGPVTVHPTRWGVGPHAVTVSAVTWLHMTVIYPLGRWVAKYAN